jgi:hydroxymethylpyrimidine pyrophosphatase-like HAD family hydrolase
MSRNLKALATDYDGTIAFHGFVEESTSRALFAFQEAGKKLMLVTGRELPELLKIFPAAAKFDIIVAENGGLLWFPDGRRELLGPEIERPFVDCLRARGVHPLSVGHCIVGTQSTYRGPIQEIIDETNAPLQLIENKGSLMILPRGIDKASGLRAACRALGITPHEVAGVGDAENDQVFLAICGHSAAVANALPALKERVDFVSEFKHGTGVEEFMARVLCGTLPPSRQTLPLFAGEGRSPARLAHTGTH